jgi:hypothetical protein
MNNVKPVSAAALLMAACLPLQSVPAAAQSYQSQCKWVGKTYYCHSMSDSARSTTYTTCASGRGQSGCSSYTERKAPPVEPKAPNPGGRMIVVRPSQR